MWSTWDPVCQNKTKKMATRAETKIKLNKQQNRQFGDKLTFFLQVMALFLGQHSSNLLVLDITFKTNPNIYAKLLHIFSIGFSLVLIFGHIYDTY